MPFSPSLHSIGFVVSTFAICLTNLPNYETIQNDSDPSIFLPAIETSSTSLTSGILDDKKTLGLVRLFIGLSFLCTTIYIILFDSWTEATHYLPGSKLKSAPIRYSGLKSQVFFTKWSWNLLTISAITSGLVTLLAPEDDDDDNDDHHQIYTTLRMIALLCYEIAAPNALLVAAVVKYALWPQLLKEGGPSRTERFKEPTTLIQHNANAIYVLAEVGLMGRLPVLMHHVCVAPLFGLVFVCFSWFMATRLIGDEEKQKTHGPQFMYFFLDTTLGISSTLFLAALLAVFVIFYGLLSICGDLFLLYAPDGNVGLILRASFVLLSSALVCRFRD